MTTIAGGVETGDVPGDSHPARTRFLHRESGRSRIPGAVCGATVEA